MVCPKPIQADVSRRRSLPESLRDRLDFLTVELK
jgi:hypothetical protein